MDVHFIIIMIDVIIIITSVIILVEFLVFKLMFAQTLESYESKNKDLKL